MHWIFDMIVDLNHYMMVHMIVDSIFYMIMVLKHYIMVHMVVIGNLEEYLHEKILEVLANHEK